MGTPIKQLCNSSCRIQMRNAKVLLLPPAVAITKHVLLRGVWTRKNAIIGPESICVFEGFESAGPDLAKCLIDTGLCSQLRPQIPSKTSLIPPKHTNSKYKPIPLFPDKFAPKHLHPLLLLPLATSGHSALTFPSLAPNSPLAPPLCPPALSASLLYPQFSTLFFSLFVSLLTTGKGRVPRALCPLPSGLPRPPSLLKGRKNTVGEHICPPPSPPESAPLVHSKSD